MGDFLETYIKQVLLFFLWLYIFILLEVFILNHFIDQILVYDDQVWLFFC